MSASKTSKGENAIEDRVDRGNVTPEIRKILLQIPELGLVLIGDGMVEFTPPRFNLHTPLVGPVLSYLKAYSSVRRFSGQFFLCMYDGWREYSRHCSSPIFVPWRDVDPSRYVPRGSQGEPRFMHLYDDGIYPEMPLPVITFCRHHGDRNALLIPDWEFLYDQFSRFTDDVEKSDKPWKAKDGNTLFWRGSHQRVRSFNEPSPRDFITSLADSRVDAKYSNRDVPISEFLNHKYLLDVDGMVSAWSGLFWKLRSNSVPVKLASHWEQWYYPLLEDDKHIVVTNRADSDDVNGQFRRDVNTDRSEATLVIA